MPHIFFIVLLCLIAFTPHAHALKASNQCKKQEWHILQQLHHAQSCEQDSDCGTQQFACPFGCAVALNINHPDLPEIKQTIQSHLKNCQHCKETCLPPSTTFACLSGLCTYRIENIPTFPEDPRHLQDILGITPTVHTNKKGRTTYRWHLKDGITIRYEHHPENDISPDDKDYYPRHHGNHYHVTQKPEFNNSKKLNNKIKPYGYLLGSGTGFLAGESMPKILLPFVKIPRSEEQNQPNIH